MTKEFVRMLYYGTRLSDNLSLREPEGYLLCLNVPVARTGTQEYLPEELGLPPGPAPIPVFRPAEEVFSPECIASFQGMPVTNDHPPDGVTVENARALQRGHVHNVRRGAGEESDLLLADLMITDPALIDAILHRGKREISCGYTYSLCEENGQYCQRQIRGNHVAVVDAGRAGPRVSIRDGQPSAPDPTKPERSTPMKKEKLAKMVVRIARDMDPEQAAELIQELIDPEAPVAVAVSEAPEPAPVGVGEPLSTASGGNLERGEVNRNKRSPQCGAAPIEIAEGVAPEETAPDEDPVLIQILQKLDQLIAILTPAAPVTDEDPSGQAEEIAEAVEEVLEAVTETTAEAADPAPALEEELAAIMEEIVGEDPEGSAVLSPDADPEDPERASCTADAYRAALAAVRPVLRKMDPVKRRKAAADLSARMGRPGRKTPSVYAALAAARDRKPAPADLGKRIMEKRNPNYNN